MPSSRILQKSRKCTRRDKRKGEEFTRVLRTAADSRARSKEIHVSFASAGKGTNVLASSVWIRDSYQLSHLSIHSHIFYTVNSRILHEENFMAIFTTVSVVIWFSTGTLGIFATLVYVYTMRVIIYDIVSMAIIPTLSTSILFCN